MRRLNWFMVVTAFAASRVYAQDLTGDWQGSLNAAPQELRVILNITRTDSGAGRPAQARIKRGSVLAAATRTSSFMLARYQIRVAVGHAQRNTTAPHTAA